jgi:4-amino-4-deoxy-L-arabinose transferase-like glycosyltransferase
VSAVEPIAHPPWRDAAPERSTGREDEARGDDPTTSLAFLRDLLILAIGAGVLFFAALGARDLWNPNEPIYGRAVVEMAERGDWTMPTVNGKVFAEKPIGYYWAARAISLLFGGISEWTLRVPSALAGVGSVLLTYLFVLPYCGRRRAWIAAALLATMFQVFWTARAVQMDILVLGSMLGVLVPLTRMIDFGMRPSRAWALAGLAAGAGFLAKGPVAWVLPALVILAYAASRRRVRALFGFSTLLGIAVAVAITAPWYVTLAFEGEVAFLHEVLIRQNVSRFLSAWDHQRPWWYYLTYVWIDFAPWSWLLPSALMIRGRSAGERRLILAGWIWIAAVMVFFSLSDSKRSPYILPMAPAVAALAAGVVDRWSTRSFSGRRAWIAAYIGFFAFALTLAGAGTWVLLERSTLPGDLRQVGAVLGIVALVSGGVLASGLFLRRERSAHAPLGVFLVMLTLYLGAGTWALPAADVLKSDRSFVIAMREQIAPGEDNIVSYRLWDWRAGYPFYADRTIPNLQTPTELRSYTDDHDPAYVIVEENQRQELQALIPTATLVLQRRIGSRRVHLFATRSPIEAARPARR